MHTELETLIDGYDRGALSRRQLIACMTGIAAAAAAAPRVLAQNAITPATSSSTFKGTDLNHIALTVTDVNRSRDFYMKHLGLSIASQGPRNCFLRCSEHNFLALFKGAQPAMNHYCFSVEDYDAAGAVEKLKAENLSPRRSGNRVYFDDPDKLEVQVAAKEHNV